MTEQRKGKVIARGSTEFVSLVMLALDECVRQPLHDLPRRDYVIEEHTPAEFRERGFVFKNAQGQVTGINEGRVVRTGLLWINSRIVRRKPMRARHIVRHEVAHVIPLSAMKRLQLMAKMTRADGTHPSDWRAGAYEAKPYECFADTMAEAASGIDSPWDDFAFYQLDVADTDVPLFPGIAVAPDGAPEAPTVEPDPLPPLDPRVPFLEEQVKHLTEDLAIANKRIADKDAKFQEGLLL